MPTFDPRREGFPTGQPSRRGPDRLMRFYAIPEGFTVVKYGVGDYREETLELGAETPAGAVAVYRGGYPTTVDAGEAAALTAAGYGDYITA